MGGEGEEGVANLFDVDGAAEGDFLGVVALELNPVLVVPDTIGCHGRMMAMIFWVSISH